MALDKKFNELEKAIDAEDLNKIAALVAADSSLLLPSPTYDPLHYAIAQEKSLAAIKLIDLGFSIEQKNALGNTPLLSAAHRKLESVCLKLIDSNANLDTEGEHNYKAFELACEKDLHDTCLKLAALIDVNQLYKYDRTPLHTACTTKFQDVIDLLMARNADIHATNESGRTPLCFAAKAGLYRTCESLLKRGAHPNPRFNNINLLTEIVDSRQMDGLAMLLLQYGADPRTAPSGVNRLIGQMKNIVQAQLSKKGPFHEENYLQEGKPTEAVLYACATNLLQEYVIEPLQSSPLQDDKDLCKEICDALPVHCKQLYKGILTHRAKSSITSAPGIQAKSGALRNAIDADDVDKIAIAVAQDPTCLEPNHLFDPLNYAIGKKHSKSAIQLIELGADVNSPLDLHKIVSRRDTPLMHAANKKLEDVCLKLIEKGADIEAKNTGGFRAFSFACDNELHKVALKLAGMINMENLYPEESTALHLACFAGFQDVFDVLVERGADIYAENERKITPIIMALNYGHEHLCESLIGLGINPNSLTEKGITLLAETLKYDWQPITRMLLRNGADAKIAHPTIDTIIGEMKESVSQKLPKHGPFKEDDYLINGKPTAAVLEACASGLLLEYVIDPLLSSPAQDSKDLCQKIARSLPPQWKAQLKFLPPHLAKSKASPALGMPDSEVERS